MKNNIVLNAPINALSMGQVSFCILKELYKKNYEVSFNPIGNLDFSAYAVEHKFADFINK